MTASPAAFSGGRLHNLSKRVYFLTFLKGKDHEILLEADKPSGTASFENLLVYTLNPVEKLILEPNIKAEDGDRRPWISFVFDILALKSITPTITYSHRRRDSDDVKIKIDGKTQGNLLQIIKYFFWRFVGSLIPWPTPIKRETQIFEINLPEGLHYVEFEADRMPTFNKLVVDFGKLPQIPEEIPTADNPKWTGSFYDDTPEILLSRLVFGEARNQSKESKIGVAWVVKNRVLAKRSYFGFSYHEIILKNDGTNYQFASMNPNDVNNFPSITNPLKVLDQATRTSWSDSYKVALGVINETISDPINGAVFFHCSDLSQEEFVTKYVPGAIFVKQIGDILFYQSPL